MFERRKLWQLLPREEVLRIALDLDDSVQGLQHSGNMFLSTNKITVFLHEGIPVSKRRLCRDTANLTSVEYSTSITVCLTNHY